MGNYQFLCRAGEWHAQACQAGVIPLHSPLSHVLHLCASASSAAAARRVVKAESFALAMFRERLEVGTFFMLHY